MLFSKVCKELACFDLDCWFEDRREFLLPKELQSFWPCLNEAVSSTRFAVDCTLLFLCCSCWTRLVWDLKALFDPVMIPWFWVPKLNWLTVPPVSCSQLMFCFSASILEAVYKLIRFFAEATLEGPWSYSRFGFDIFWREENAILKPYPWGALCTFLASVIWFCNFWIDNWSSLQF